MSLLARYEEDLLFDSCLGLTLAQEAAHLEVLTARDERAADLQARILVVLVPLESVHCAPCPEDLAERTVRLLCAAAQAHKR